MRARGYIAVSYVGDATMLYVGHTEHFKIPGAARYFCLRDCLHMRGPEVPAMLVG